MGIMLTASAGLWVSAVSSLNANGRVPPQPQEPTVGKLTEAQIAAWRWTHNDCARPWHGTIVGDPHTSVLMSLVRRGWLKKDGGNGFDATYERTPAGRAALQESNNDA